MAKVVTESFRVESTNDFVSSFDDLTNNDYYIMGSSYSPDGAISNSQSDIREFERRVIFGNKISTPDVRYMFNINPWTTGTIYDAFDDSKDMSSKNFYVTVLDGPINETSYKVFKCIRNNKGQPSTTSPSTAIEENNFETTEDDGYIWKFLFAVPPSDYIQFATSQFLPYVKSAFVEQNAQQGISDIVIESSPVGHFSGYVIGPNSAPSQGTMGTVIKLNDTTYQVEVICDQEVKATAGSYRNMYFRIPSTGDVYEIVDSYPSSDITQTKRVNLQVTAANLDNSLIDKPVEIIPKIEITVPNHADGVRAIAYGIIDSAGTLQSVGFKTKGSHYNFATAKLQEPGKDVSTTVTGSNVRVVHSPTGGHGSNPVHELFMSRIETVTNFFSGVTTETPSTNTYTKVGVVKNPKFKEIGTTVADYNIGNRFRITNLGVGDQQNNWNVVAGTNGVVYSVGDVITFAAAQSTNGGLMMSLPDTFDNRVVLVLIGILTEAQAAAGFYVTQTENGETCSGVIHEVEFVEGGVAPENPDVTLLHLTDTSGTFRKQFNNSQPIVIKETEGSTSTTYSGNINSVTLNTYIPYSGELLHFVDFDPITRTDSSKEKVKLIFDF